MKIGILGGTFDPIHIGHVEIALAATKQCDLDCTWIMPAKLPPHKKDSHIIEDKHRIAMVLAAVSEHPELELSLFEFERETVSYTADTLQLLHERYPEHELVYIMGEDSLGNLPTWYCPEKVVSLATIAVASREPENSSLYALIEERRAQYGGRFVALTSPWKDVSSTEIRERLGEGRSISGMVPETVEQYILYRGLYRKKDEM